MRRLCRFVPFVVLLASGCFDSHGAERDGSVPADGAVSLDARVPRDAAPFVPDAASCDGTAAVTRATGACLGSSDGVVPPETPTSIEVRVDGGCFCAAELRCDARVTGDFELSLTTSVCQAPVDCDACQPRITTQCALPPLASGTWRVLVNDAEAFELPVAPPEPGAAVTTCWDFAEVVDRASLECPFPGAPFAAFDEVVCSPVAASAGESIAVRVTDSCAGCDTYYGPCEVTVIGSSIHVGPTERHCTCDTCGVCPPSCDVVERLCHLPPLERGVYELTATGAEGSIRIAVDVLNAEPGEVCLRGVTAD